jgi:hypothetical protein
MNTDKHRFYMGKTLKEKRPNGTRMNTDKHGFILAKDLKTKDGMGHR